MYFVQNARVQRELNRSQIQNFFVKNYTPIVNIKDVYDKYKKYLFQEDFHTEIHQGTKRSKINANILRHKRIVPLAVLFVRFAATAVRKGRTGISADRIAKAA
jgi:hypothetical protein